jgi:hypothetical protein
MDLPLVSDTIVSNASIAMLSYLVSVLNLCRCYGDVGKCRAWRVRRPTRREGLEDLETIRLFVHFEMFGESNRIYRRTR